MVNVSCSENIMWQAHFPAKVLLYTASTLIGRYPVYLHESCMITQPLFTATVHTITATKIYVQ